MRTLVLGLALLTGCTSSPPEGGTPGASPSRAAGGTTPGRAHPEVIVVGVDGLDPELLAEQIAAGRMPVMAALVARGARGTLEPLDPMLSPLLWTTMVTGSRPEEHGITDFVEKDPQTGALQSITSARRRRPALWEILPRYGKRAGVVALWATWPAETVDGFVVSDRLVGHGFRVSQEVRSGLAHPAAFTEPLLALARDAEEVPLATLQTLADVSEADWLASKGRDVSDPLKHLALATASTATVRDAALWAAGQESVDLLFVYLEALDTVSHLFMRHRGSSDPAAAPYRETVDRFHAHVDAALAPLLALAGGETTVIVLSDHGFRHGEDRPQDDGTAFDERTAVRWHRKPGTIVAAGPGVARGAALAGGILDVTPTLLALLGLPAGADMPGRAIAGIAPSEIPRIATHGRREGSGPTSVADPELVAKLEALGYVGGGGEAPAPQETAPSRFNVGRSRQASGDLAGARRAYEEALAVDPRFVPALANLAVLDLMAGRPDDARPRLEQVLAIDPRHTGSINNLAVIEMDRDPAKAEELLRRSMAIDPSRADAPKNLAALLLSRGRTADALEAIERAVRLTPEDPEARRLEAAIRERLPSSPAER